MGKKAIFLIGGLAVLAILSNQDDKDASKTPEQKARAAKIKQVEQETRRKKGFHCLSAWDGTNSALVRAVKPSLREPDSFEHIETRITPVKGGWHGLFMKFRSRNGFGGMTITLATAKISNSDCRVTNVRFAGQG